ncbi:MAG: M4 family metallopeptidase [Acidobacteria bacterium]|nr:M4 family metallopeptidase [Acidobacteriota bacterium]
MNRRRPRFAKAEVGRRTFLHIAVVVGIAAASVPGRAQSDRHSGLVAIQPATVNDWPIWNARIDAMERAGELRVRSQTADDLAPDRRHERLDQYYRGVRVFGGDLTRQLAGDLAVSAFGTIYDGIDLDPTPALTAEEAAALVNASSGDADRRRAPPELLVLPSRGTYALVYRDRVRTGMDVIVYFVDARSGELVLQYSDRKTQTSAVGRGTGVLRDSKKVSAASQAGLFATIDQLRPARTTTMDFKGDAVRLIRVLNGEIGFVSNDIARDTDNDWTDGPVVDAHAYAGYTYDYYFKRFNRRGLNDRDLPILAVAHPVSLDHFFNYPPDIQALFYLNAFYDTGGLIVLGEGLPPGVRDARGRTWIPLAGALDVIAHELTHGVTEFTSNLIYRNESGALNEAFSDIMATGVEFFFQPPGLGPMRADYLIGEDVVTPGGVRTMVDPSAYGDPDHYSLRYVGPEDNGGVHINASIVTHVFYLAIEGGTNGVSGLSVQGVGSPNREQMERVFYRAFTQLMPSNADFAMARVITIRAAQDLYGAGSAPERAVTQAWTAVGVR